jgi:hypothetical protein
MSRSTQQRDLWVGDLAGAPETDRQDVSLLVNRRRPGRAQRISPELVSLLRERELSAKRHTLPVLPEVDEVEHLNWFHFLISFFITLTLSVSVWAVIFMGGLLFF